MNPEIRTNELSAVLSGASTPHDSKKCYGDEIKKLLDHVLGIIRGRSIANKGINWVIYDAGALFARAELIPAEMEVSGLERRVVRLGRHAYWKHVGPYQLLGETCAAMKKSVEVQGLRPGAPLIEIYGHWNEDPAKLETEIVFPVS